MTKIMKRLFKIISVAVLLVVLTAGNSGLTVAQSLTDNDKEAILRETPYYDSEGNNQCAISSRTVSGNGIYVIGDSYAQGIEGTLKPKLSELGYEVSGWNAVQGRSITGPGRNPDGYGQRGIDALETDSDVIKKSGTMIVILGTNGISSADITDFMNKAHSYNPTIRTFWVNVNYPRDPANVINQKNQSISSGASELNYSIIDWYAASNPHMSDYFSDVLHPNPKGYKVITGLLESALQAFTTSGTGSVSEVSGFNNTDYAGNNILNKAQLDTIQENQRFYQAAADKYNIPWQMIAVIHMREHSLQRHGPDNGQGPYQFESGGYKIGDYTDEEFQSATDDAAKFILNKADGRDLASVDNIKYTLFAYNGRSPVLIDQGIKLGFSQEQANIGEGSPYVMNRADAKRDPTVEPTKSNNTWGQFQPDFQYPANTDYGAFVQYGAIANVGSSGGCGSNLGLTSGGMTMEQAKAFMEIYKTSPDSESYLNIGAYRGCTGENVLGNCTAFSTYFINKYTTLKGYTGDVRVGYGRELAGLLAERNSGVTIGAEPKVYAVFSSPATPGNSSGHTGVVLGIDTAKGTIITGEASCDSGLIGAYIHTIQEIKSENWTFTYTDGNLKGL